MTGRQSLIQLSNSKFSTKLLHHHSKSTSAKNQHPIKFVFQNPINFTLKESETWAIIGTSYKSDFLRALSGGLIAYPPHSRSYPTSLQDPNFKVDLLQFVNNGSRGLGTNDSSGGFTHLSSRYEFYKDLEVDEKLSDFIANMSYNSSHVYIDENVDKLIQELKLNGLKDKFITSLSNGQFRRARIAKELYREPTVLLIDDPFLGLDPVATNTVSNVLMKTAQSTDILTTIGIGLRIQDDIPDWIEKIAIVDSDGVVAQGDKLSLLSKLSTLRAEYFENQLKIENEIKNRLNSQPLITGNSNNNKPSASATSEPPRKLIEMDNVNIKHRGQSILKDLKWTVHHNEKWHIRGKNGSGKTTLLSLITLDHPQSWNKQIKINGVQRETGKTNYFDNGKLIGFASPELHSIFPKNLTIFDAIATGYVVGSYVPPDPNSITPEQAEKIKSYLKIVGLQGCINDKFADVSLSSQKLVLLIRAMISDPKILILDEALSAMSDEDILKGKSLINNWNKGAVLVIGHVDHEVSKCDKFILMDGAKNGIYEIGEC